MTHKKCYIHVLCGYSSYCNIWKNTDLLTSFWGFKLFCTLYRVLILWLICNYWSCIFQITKGVSIFIQTVVRHNKVKEFILVASIYFYMHSYQLCYTKSIAVNNTSSEQSTWSSKYHHLHSSFTSPTGIYILFHFYIEYHDIIRSS